ncbi:MAG: regulatory protein RecX [Clostridia bacterium]|nr:regulatory protein RecX [Clostridia bacterium]
MRTVVSVAPWRNSEKLKVSLSDGSYFLAKRESDAAALLAEGDEIDDEALARWRAHGGLTASEAAGMILGRRYCSERELWEKLTQKGYTSTEAADAVSKMREYGLVDDAQYARDVVEMCLAKKRSKRHIMEELRHRGINKDLAEELLQDVTDQKSAVREILEKKYGDIDALSREQKSKAINYLRSRGFEWQDIAPVIKGLDEY